MRGTLVWTSKSSPGSSAVPAFLPWASTTSTVTFSAMSASRTLHGVTHEHDAALGAGDGALDEQQPLLGVDRVHGQGLDGLAHVAHAASPTRALEHAAAPRRPTDRAGLAVVAERTLPGARTAEAVPLPDACGALAHGHAVDGDLRPAL